MSSTRHGYQAGNNNRGTAVQETGAARENAILVGVRRPRTPPGSVDEHLSELQLLTETAGGRVVGRVIQQRERPDPATFIGKGKAEVLIHQATGLDCRVIIFDDDLSASQQRNLQRIAGDGMKVLDRSGLIIDIFARRARTREAKTQVELARLEYLLPRLTRQWTHLERQMGGIGTRGGPGEAQIEVDRRLIRSHIARLKKDLQRIAAERATQSRGRRKAFRVALVGYTNAGKSTLMNALTGADVFVEDRLFATLDTTTRKLPLEDSTTILLSDTVGFIRKLPHHLIASFRSTLAEVIEADLLLKVLDASTPAVDEHYRTINEALAELGLADKPALVVLNKLDAVEDSTALAALQRRYFEAHLVSALQHLRLDRLEAAIREAYRRDFQRIELRIPAARAGLISAIYDALEVEDRRFEAGMTVLTVFGPGRLIRSFRSRIRGK